MRPPMPGADIVDRLFEAAEHDTGIPASEAQALFIEAAEMIMLLRSLLEPDTDDSLEASKPQGHA